MVVQVTVQIVTIQTQQQENANNVWLIAQYASMLRFVLNVSIL